MSVMSILHLTDAIELSNQSYEQQEKLLLKLTANMSMISITVAEISKTQCILTDW